MSEPGKSSCPAEPVASDQALADRVAKLRSMQAEMAGVEARIMALVPRPAAAEQSRAPIGDVAAWWRTARTIAIALLVAAVAGVALFDWSVHPAMASAQDIAQLHEDALAGRVDAVPVNSIEAASKTLADKWPQLPALPLVPSERVTACGVSWVRGKPVACVLIDHDGAKVTMTVARLADLAMPLAPIVSRSGAAYCVQAVRGMNMVMTERDGAWVCLIGKVAPDQLMDLEGRMQF